MEMETNPSTQMHRPIWEFRVQKLILIDIVNITFPHFMPFYQSQHQIHKLSFRLLQKEKKTITETQTVQKKKYSRQRGGEEEVEKNGRLSQMPPHFRVLLDARRTA